MPVPFLQVRGNGTGKKKLFDDDVERIQEADHFRKRKLGPFERVLLEIDGIIVGFPEVSLAQVAARETGLFEHDTLEVRFCQIAFQKKAVLEAYSTEVEFRQICLDKVIVPENTVIHGIDREGLVSSSLQLIPIDAHEQTVKEGTILHPAEFKLDQFPLTAVKFTVMEVTVDHSDIGELTLGKDTVLILCICDDFIRILPILYGLIFDIIHMVPP